LDRPDKNHSGALEKKPPDGWTSAVEPWYEQRVLPLHFVVLLAGIQGLTEALPVSRSGHDAVAGIWLESGMSGAQLETVLHLATASALMVAARRRLVAALAAGLLAITRPTLFRSSAPAHDAAVLATAIVSSLLSRAVVDHFAAPWKATPVAIGFGLLLTGLLLATTTLVQAPRNDEPSVLMAIVVGLGHGMATLPGGSDIGVALVLLSWLGTKTDLALDVAMLLTAATLVANCLGAVYAGAVLPDIPLLVFMMGIVTAFLGTTVAIRALRYLLEKRALALAACWTVPIGLATLAYARAVSEGLSLATIVR
jgi:undecaprenyl-diphosphatase